MGIFSKKNIDETAAGAEKAKGGGGRLKAGIHLLKLLSTEVKQSKAGNWMIVMNVGNGEQDAITEFFVFDEKNIKSAMKIVEFMKNSFQMVFEPIDAMTIKEEATMVNDQIQSFIGKSFKAAIKEWTELYDKKNDDGTFTLLKLTKPKLWYTGLETEDLLIDLNRSVVPLSEEDTKRWVKECIRRAEAKKNRGEKEDDGPVDEPKSGNVSKRAGNDGFEANPKGENPIVEDDLPF